MVSRNMSSCMICVLTVVVVLKVVSAVFSNGLDTAFMQSTARSSGRLTWFGPKPASSRSRGGHERSLKERECSASTQSQRISNVARRSLNRVSMSASPPHIIIAGAPASGKGTQCAMIKEQYGVTHLSTGDILRQAVVDQTEVGMRAKGFMDEGKLVPDDVIIDIVRDRLAEEDCQMSGWLLDGFPRTRAQADALKAAGIKADIFLLLNVPDEVLIARVVGRRLDPQTGDIYHLEFSPPPAEIMDRLVHRADDTEDKARIRLQAYHSNIEAIRACYEDVTCSLDGAQPKSEVFGAIKRELDSRIEAAAGLRGGAIVDEVETEPIEGMKPGTSGLRKKETA